MDSLPVTKDQLVVVSDNEAHIDNPTLADLVRTDPTAVAKKMSDLIGPVSTDQLSVDDHGRVIVKHPVFVAAAKVVQASPLDGTNLVFCDSNHHVICR